MELLCPAGNMASLKSAVKSGADAVYIGLKDDTNARHFAGLNFTAKKLKQAAEYTKAAGCKLYVAINTFPSPGEEARWHQAISLAADARVDALIMADIGLLHYAKTHYPEIELHLSVQASATSLAALSMYQNDFNVTRAVLPRVLDIKQVMRLAKKSPIELEVFAYGSLCIMSEGRCHLSSYVTGHSPNTGGACSPSQHVRWSEHDGVRDTHLNGVLLDRNEQDAASGYPVVCKGRYQCDDEISHTLESPTSLNTLSLLPELYLSGVAAVKIEGRQRSPAYVEQVTRVWREAIDQVKLSPEQFVETPRWNQILTKLSEGQIATLGPYERSWQ
ncbi:ubiquinone anaerobic biosynthesis protein UbiU [Paraferrimonas haliotis]|uniref:Ubiquinone biosynthesis protein UbiU n=1 Tax=Paraferrimonas haliotis TaxID=2013866 RepID=A0AA37TWB9_9GAMM|nr:peptidase U32 family protein [Paraferrimonas haliotis]GLS82751.1 protease [Paraferrimonas haliotis]